MKVQLGKIWVKSMSSVKNFRSCYSNATFTGRPTGGEKKGDKKMSIFSGYV